ncbi:MAG: molybdate ABC transporter substrate-binding protein [Clostridiaceae bacterium]
MIKLKKSLTILLFSVLVTCLVVGCSAKQEDKKVVSASEKKTESLLVYSGAGLNKPMDEIGNKFEEKYGVEIQYTYAGSNQLLSQIELSGKGDVFIPGSNLDYDNAKKKGLVGEKHDVAYHIPVIAVPKENPKKIQNLEDLAKPEVKVALGDEKACAIGICAKKILEKNKLYDKVMKNVVTTTATVNELVVHTSMKQADATIIWEDNVMNVPDIKAIQIPKEKNTIKTIPIAVVEKSQNKEMAEKFVEYVSSDEGKLIFEKHGFKSIK